MLPSPLPGAAVPNHGGSHFVTRYIDSIGLAPGIVKLITQSGVMVAGSVKSASDFSYSSNSYAGQGYRIIGDAGGVIGPSLRLFTSTLNRFCSVHRPLLLQWRSPGNDIRAFCRCYDLRITSKALYGK